MSEKEHWIYGINPVLEALKAGRRIKAIYIYSGRREKIEEVYKEAEHRDIPIKITGLSFFDERFPKGHQGVAAKAQAMAYTTLDELLEIPEKRGEAPFFLLLDGIEDPRNLGAIIRSAEAAGVHGVVIQSRRAAGLGPEVYKASAGAVQYLPVSEVANIKNAIYNMKDKGITIIGAEAGGERKPWELDMTVPVSLVIGSEGKGIRKTVREKCDFIISLPMKGRVNSLNVSVAGGIILFEILRQRSKN